MVTSQTSSRSFSASYFFQPFARSRLIKSLLLSILSPPDLKFLDDNGLYCRLCPVQCTGSLPSAVNQLTVIVFHLGSLTTRTLLKNRGVADEIATDPVGVSHYQRVKL